VGLNKRRYKLRAPNCTQVPVYLAAKYRRNGVYKDARTILAIHNLSHQGVDPAATFANLGLPDDMCVD